MYSRKEKAGGDDNYEELKTNDLNAYTKLVAHAARVGMEMGADLIKTHYTGDSDTFRNVVDACAPVPVVVAGGLPTESLQVLPICSWCIGRWCAGISFGRNIFSRRDRVLSCGTQNDYSREGKSRTGALENGIAAHETKN